MTITLMLYKEMKYLEKVAIKTENYYNPYSQIKTKLDDGIYSTDIVVSIDNKFVCSVVIDSDYLKYMVSNVRDKKGLIYEKNGNIYGKITRIEPTTEERVYVAFLEGDSTYINQLDIHFIESKINELNKLTKHKYTREEVEEEKEHSRKAMKGVLQYKVEHELNKEISKYGNLFICTKRYLNKMKDNILKNVFES